MDINMKLRRYCPDDLNEISKLFYNTIHSINNADYTPIQLDAWAPKAWDLAKFNEKLLRNYTVVVEFDKIIIGFGSADNIGHFDLLYSHRDYQSRGVATLICENIEHHIFSKNIETITTDSSITAKPFFRSRGYRLVAKQRIECRGQFFVNFKMKKVVTLYGNM